LAALFLTGAVSAASAGQWMLYDLGTLGGSSWASGISGNNSTDPNARTAVIVGSYGPGNKTMRAFFFDAQQENNVLSGSMTALDVGGFSSAQALAINPSSFNIVGASQDSHGNVYPCYWANDGSLQTLPFETGPAIGAYGVNDAGYHCRDRISVTGCVPCDVLGA